MRIVARALMKRITRDLQTGAVARKSPKLLSSNALTSSVLANNEEVDFDEDDVFRKAFDATKRTILTAYDKKEANEYLRRLLNEEDVRGQLLSARNSALLGFDTETRPTFSATRERNRTAVVQLSSRNLIVLTHLKAMDGEVPEVLKEILDDSRFVLVGIGILSDLKELREEYYLHSSGVKSFVDLGTVAKTYGKKELGMKALSQYYGYDAEKPKSVQISNWESVPLSDAQIKYAAEDAALAVWIAERMYAEYNDYKNRENKNGKRSRTSAEDDKDVDGFLKWMLAFKNAGNTRSLNKHKLPRNALKSLISSETERVDKYAKERFSQARDLIKKVSSDIKHPTSALMEFFDSLSKTLPRREDAPGGGGRNSLQFQFGNLSAQTQTQTNIINQEGEEEGHEQEQHHQQQKSNNFFCKVVLEDISEHDFVAYGECLTKKNAKAKACKEAFTTKVVETWLKNFENDWFQKLTLEEKQRRLSD